MANLSTLVSGGSSPFGSLPVETLIHIFKLTLDDEAHVTTQADQLDVHAQRAVCRHWRDTHGVLGHYVVAGLGSLLGLAKRFRLLKKLRHLETLDLGDLVLAPARHPVQHGLAWCPTTLRCLRLTLVGGVPSRVVPSLIATSAATLTSIEVFYGSRSFANDALLDGLGGALPRLEQLALTNLHNANLSVPILPLLSRLTSLTSARLHQTDVLNASEANSLSAPPSLTSVFLVVGPETEIRPRHVLALAGHLGALKTLSILHKLGRAPWRAQERDELRVQVEGRGLVLRFDEMTE